MKESYHICFTSHQEVMFRDEEDHGMFVNLMALRGFKHDTQVLADAEMSTHVHMNVFSKEPVSYGSSLRMSYTKYFNRKYGRTGRMGEPGIYLLRVRGINHQIALNNYILRNGLHHGASSTAFGYPYSSVRDMFAKELGGLFESNIITSRSEICSYLPRHSEFPDNYVMDANGVFRRDSFMEIRQVEQFYVSPKNYLFQMNRLTDESWDREQEKDGTDCPIRISDVELGYSERDIAELLKNENGRKFRETNLQDIDVCRLIDRGFLSKYKVSSVYGLNSTQKKQISRTLYYDFHLPEKQIRRCLAMPPV